MGSEAEQVPDERCGFELRPEDVGHDEEFDDMAEWRKVTSAVSCWRPTWDDKSDTSRCIWHAAKSGKAVDELRSARATHPERLDGAILDNVELNNQLSLTSCGLLGADIRDADLSEADLSGANLRNADLRDANLLDADLRGAALIHADLREAYLVHADLRDTLNSDADFQDADLFDADFRGASFFHCKLSRFYPLGSRFSGGPVP